MKLLAVSDRVDPHLYGPGLEARAAGVEAVISCGDLPFEYLEYLVTFLGAPLFYVRGNHDASEDSGKRPGGCVPLDLRVEELDGLALAGVSGCRWYSGGANQYTARQMRRRVRDLSLRIAARSLLGKARPKIFVSHAPPLGLGDAEDPCHRGIEPFLSLMDRNLPGLWLHGHVHLYGRDLDDSDGDLTRNNTRIVNAYRYRILEL